MARILVVDDERSLRRTFALFLRDDGHEVETAEDVDQALASLERAQADQQPDGLGQFDVVVSDIILPRRSGVSLMEVIAERWPDIKVILVTGEPTVETAASAVRSGAYDYVSKPVSSAKIRKIVASAARVKALQDDNRRLQSENDRQRSELAKPGELQTAQVRSNREAPASTDARISRIAANMPGVLLQFEQRSDGEFGFTFLADSAESMFGLIPAEVVADAQVFFDRVHADDRQSLADSLSSSAASSSLWTWEGRFMLPSGELRWLQAQSRPLRRADGTIVWDGVLLDTSERQHLQARGMLADRMASIGTLAAGVAHEINNPLTYVLANLHILDRRAVEAVAGDDPNAQQTMCSDDTLELLRETAEGAGRIRDIARDLKTFSHSSDQLVPLDVGKVLDSSLRMATHEIRHRARVERSYEPTPLVLANSSRLGQVFLNLLVNAAQAIPESAFDQHRIQLITRTAADGFAEVVVADTGSGIAAPLLDRIFDPFLTMKPIGVGTGLGLYTCRSIIDQLGGAIEVESAPGRTLFKVRLPPAHGRPAPPPVSDRRNPNLVASPRPSSARLRVLVIDDEANIGRSFLRALPDHALTVVDCGRAGLDRLDAGEQFDVIFCDVMMPDLSGQDVHEQLGARHPAMLDRVVFMTGGAFTQRASEFIERVANRRIDKPFDLASIRAALREVAAKFA